jgi:hypothetical protein
MMSSQSIPVEALPFLYISGLNISVASNTVIAVAPGQCRDSNDNIDMPYYFPFGGNSIYAERHNNGLIPPPLPQYTNAMSYSLPLFINSAVVGVNGLDQGTLAASTNYVIYLIADSTNKLQPAGLLTLQSNAFPLIPLGYDSYRLLGFVSTDSSTHFTAASVLNAVNEKGYYLSPAVSVLSGGNATSFTAIDLSSAIPTTTDPFVIALLAVTFIPSAAGDVVQFRPTGSSATANLVTITGNVAGVAQTNYIAVNCGVASSKPEIDYKVSVSGDSVSVSVQGYYVTLS